MTIRIHALAKDFDIESKVLIELCRQLGIKSNASALTVLTDDNVAKIKDHLASHPQKTAADFATPANFTPAPPLPMNIRNASGSTQNNKSRSQSKAPAKSKASDSALSNLTDDDLAKVNARLKQLFTKKEGCRFPIRLNLLAKVLKIESKALFDLCQQLGIKCKGGALTNLMSVDVAKIKTHFEQLSSQKEGCRFPIRLYLLAKELKIESKVLIDLCQQLGIKCKGGALTNLVSADVAKIKAHFEQ